MVPGMISALTKINFIDKCVDLTISENSVLASRAIFWFMDTLSTSLPFFIFGQQVLVEEYDLKIPNMTWIMMAIKK